MLLLFYPHLGGYEYVSSFFSFGFQLSQLILLVYFCEPFHAFQLLEASVQNFLLEHCVPKALPFWLTVNFGFIMGENVLLQCLFGVNPSVFQTAWYFPCSVMSFQVIHHLMSVVSLALAIQCGHGHIYLYIVLFSECTTPFVNLRWCVFYPWLCDILYGSFMWCTRPDICLVAIPLFSRTLFWSQHVNCGWVVFLLCFCSIGIGCRGISSRNHGRF